jgi:hypothetical protein
MHSHHSTCYKARDLADRTHQTRPHQKPKVIDRTRNKFKPLLQTPAFHSPAQVRPASSTAVTSIDTIVSYALAAIGLNIGNLAALATWAWKHKQTPAKSSATRYISADTHLIRPALWLTCLHRSSLSPDFN